MSKENDVTEELRDIPLDAIVANRNQPRQFFDETSLKDLAASIDNNGLIQPITVRHLTDDSGHEEYEIIAGERRWRAHQLLERATIKAIVKLSVDDKQSAVHALIENLDRENLNPMEEARAYDNLMHLEQWNQGEIAKHLGKSRSSIANTLRLLKLPPDVVKLMEQGLLEKQAGMALASITDSAKSVKMATQAIKGGWNLKQLRKSIDKLREDGDAAPKRKKEVPKKVVKKKAPKFDFSRAILVIFDEEEGYKEMMEAVNGEDVSVFTGDELKQLLEA